MSLHDELAGDTQNPCKLCAYIGGLSAADAREWERELALPVNEVGNTAVVNALLRRDLNVAESSVRRHRLHHVV